MRGTRADPGDGRVVHGRPRRPRGHRGPRVVRVPRRRRRGVLERRQGTASSASRPTCSTPTGRSPPRSRSRWPRACARGCRRTSASRSPGSPGRTAARRRSPWASSTWRSRATASRWCAASSGRATDRRTSATRRGRRSRCCSSGSGAGVTVRAAADVGAGLAPARDRAADRPRRADPRRGRRRRGRVRRGAPGRLGRGVGGRLRPGRAGAVHAGAATRPGIEVAPAHDPSHVRRGLVGGPPARLAVTKALTAIDPGQRGAGRRPRARRSRSSRGSRSSRTRPPAGGWSASRARTARAPPRAGSSTSWPSAGRDPGAFVGALLPAALTGLGVAATARRGAGDAFVVEADEYAGNFDAYRPDVIVLTSAEWDHPDVFADRAAVLAAFEAWIRRAGEREGRRTTPGCRSWSRTSATRASPSSSRGSPTGRGASSRRRSWTRPRSGSAASPGGSRSGSRAPPARPTSCSAGSRPASPTPRRSRSPASTRSRARGRSACRPPAATTR